MFDTQKQNLLGAVCKLSDLRQWQAEGIFDMLCCDPVVHRKFWEMGFVLSRLKALNLIRAGVEGLVFGCGLERTIPALASQGVHVTCTDQPPEFSSVAGWHHTGQFCRGVEDFKIFHHIIGDFNVFSKNLHYLPVDMNHIDLSRNNYDFLWSSCSLEHLGSIENSVQFVVNSMSCLGRSGVAVHTTEYDWKTNKSLDDPHNCVFSSNDLQYMRQALSQAGHLMLPIDYRLGLDEQDMYVDSEPFYFNTNAPSLTAKSDKGHLKLYANKHNLTSVGFVVLANRLRML